MPSPALPAEFEMQKPYQEIKRLAIAAGLIPLSRTPNWVNLVTRVYANNVSKF